MVASTIFFALHISGVIVVACPCLYEETSFLAFSRPEEETKRVLWDPNDQLLCEVRGLLRYTYHTIVW